jgi:hypothetical protein
MSEQSHHDAPDAQHPTDDERGAIGYIFLWLLGVPASLLFLMFILRGCT